MKPDKINWHEIVTAADCGDERAIKLIGDEYDNVSHEPSCAKRVHEACECDCVKAEMMFYVD